MMKKYLFMAILSLLGATTLVSCGDDEDVTPNIPSVPQGTITEKMASAKVQTVKIKKAVFSSIYTEHDNIPHAEQVFFYKDFKFKYSFIMYGNQLAVVPYALNSDGDMTFYKSIDNGAKLGIVDCGKVSSLAEIRLPETAYFDSWTGIPNNWNLNNLHSLAYYRIAGTPIFPNHGYFVHFNTYEDGIKWMIVYIKDYTQDSNGELLNITIDYKLTDAPEPQH